MGAIIASSSVAEAQERSWGLGSEAALGWMVGDAGRRPDLMILSTGILTDGSDGPQLMLPTLAFQAFLSREQSLQISVSSLTALSLFGGEFYLDPEVRYIFHFGEGSGRWRVGPGLQLLVHHLAPNEPTLAVRGVLELGGEILTDGRGFGINAFVKPFVQVEPGTMTRLGAGVLAGLGVAWYGGP